MVQSITLWSLLFGFPRVSRLFGLVLCVSFVYWLGVSDPDQGQCDVQSGRHPVLRDQRPHQECHQGGGRLPVGRPAHPDRPEDCAGLQNPARDPGRQNGYQSRYYGQLLGHHRRVQYHESVSQIKVTAAI